MPSAMDEESQRTDGRYHSLQDLPPGATRVGSGGLTAGDSSTRQIGTRWCLTAAVVVSLCAVSLIGVSEGWLEAMGLGHRMVHNKDCSSPKFTKQTLKLLHEVPIQRLTNTKGLQGDDLLAKLEGSGIRMAPGSADYFVIFDNSFYIGKFSSKLDFHQYRNASTNKLLPWPGKDPEEESGFEGIAFNSTSGTWLFMQEAVQQEKNFKGNVVEVFIDPITDEIRPVEGGECLADYQFGDENKGFEGIEILEHPNGKSYLLGLCEGNFCQGGKQGRKAGHGRIVIMERVESSTDDKRRCSYRTVSVADIPRDANFEDYSDLTILGKNIAIVSQATSAIWIGSFEMVGEEKGVLQLNRGWVWDFPRNDLCQVKYCNVEGVAWEDSDKIAAVSDMMKGKAKQSYHCWDKDRSLHAFAINDKGLLTGRDATGEDL